MIYRSDSPFKWLVIFTLIFSFITACTDSTAPVGAIEPGLYVLNEGTYGVPGTSELDIISGDTAIQKRVYWNTTGEELGDTPNDMVEAGGKLYILVSNPHKLVVLDLLKKTKVGEIFFGPYAPREIALVNSDIAFVTAHDSMLFKIDLNNLSKTDSAAIGQKPEGILYLYGYVFVACGGWGSDNRIFAVNINTLEADTIVEAAPNVVSLASDGQYLYAGALPVWGSPVTNPSLYKFEIRTMNIVDTREIEGGASRLRIVGEDLYFLNAALRKIDKNNLGGNIFTIAVEADYVINGYYIDNQESIWTAEFPIPNTTDPGRVVKRDLSGISQLQFEVGIFPRRMLKISTE